MREAITFKAVAWNQLHIKKNDENKIKKLSNGVGVFDLMQMR